MGAMQSSVNALFASMLGAGFAINQSPGAKELREKGNIERSLAGKEKFLKKAISEEAADRAKVEKAVGAFEAEKSQENYDKMVEARESARSSRDLGPTAYEDVASSYSRLAELTRNPNRRAEYYRKGIANESEAEKMRENTLNFYKYDVGSLIHAYERRYNVQNAVKSRMGIIDQYRTGQDVATDTLEAAKKDYERRNDT